MMQAKDVEKLMRCFIQNIQIAGVTQQGSNSDEH